MSVKVGRSQRNEPRLRVFDNRLCWNCIYLGKDEIQILAKKYNSKSSREVKKSLKCVKGSRREVNSFSLTRRTLRAQSGVTFDTVTDITFGK
jgi:hypothetical protein